MIRMVVFGMIALECVGYVASGASDGENLYEIPIEAENMTVHDGWVVEGGSYFDGQPNQWSAARLAADTTDSQAVAEKKIHVPAEGDYLLWAHYESAYGFGSVFTIEIEQAGRTQSATFGRKSDFKYFPFGIGWAVQGPWYYHNTDYVYQYAEMRLMEGKAAVRLMKAENEKPAGMRIVDFLFLTTDPSRDPGNDWSWRGENKPRILSKFKLPIYLNVEYVSGDAPILPTVAPRLYLLGYYKGPFDDYYICRDRLALKGRGQEPEDGDWLKPGDSTGWLRLDLHTAYPGWLILTQSGEAKLRVSVSHTPDGADGYEAFDWSGKRLDVLCAVGSVRFEKDLLEGRKATTMQELIDRKTRTVEEYQIPGRKARRIFLRTALKGVDGAVMSMAKLAAAMGINAVSYGIPPEIYGREAPDLGFNTTRGFDTVQNCFLNRPCLEGDFEKLEKKLQKQHDNYVKRGLGHVPVTFKLVEESGPPDLAELRTWQEINEQFRAYLKKEGIQPMDVLSREALTEVAASEGNTADSQLWERVSLGTGTYEESLRHPILYYHSHCFRTLLMARAAAGATRLLEEIWGEGTYTDSGSIYPSTGDHPVLKRGVEPFTLFRNRAVTWYSSEISWGQEGLPNYLGPQTASYEAALGRALAKYYNCPLGTYLISDPNRGYTGDMIERYAYGLLAQGFQDVQIYLLGYPAECSCIAVSDIHKGVKRISYTAGAIEDRLLGSQLMGADVAIGWSKTTDVWDLAVPPHNPRLLSNNIYPQERYLSYLLLRHAQIPVDILCEQDLTEDYLRKYNAYFLIGDHLRPEAAEALRDWVRNGGTLIAFAGGGLRDHYNRSLNTLKEVYGIEDAELAKRQYCMRPKLELLHAAPLDRIRFAEGTMDVYAFKQSISPTENTAVIGTFMDGAPAITMSKYGKGRAILVGGLPGLAYVKPAIPMLPYGRGGTDELSGFVPTEFDAQVRDFIAALVKSAGANSPVVASHPLVEATLLESSDKQHLYIVLVNYDTRPVDGLALKLTLDGQWSLMEANGVHERETSGEREIVFEKPFHKFRFLELKRQNL